ncbi:MAG: RDD family protein [Balneolaceae bacterium]|nr:RDD family protein [Balneolaceae bacterium]MBO6547570.1 RDD family protein [Balneolaceae bacterium]MBO6648081.1 RDD family protein [Balneolaceae bacterium]
MNQIGVETTQHVKLNYNPAPIGDRLIAFLIDGFTLMAFYFVAMMAFGFASSFSDSMNEFVAENQWIIYAVYMIPSFFYHLIFEISWNGKSFGKWLMGLQVVKVDGTNPSIGNYIIRWIFRLVEITLTSGMVAFITVLVNGKGQRLGDIAAKTCVIKIRKKVQLSDTIYSELNDEYEVKYSGVQNLSDEQIRTIKDVLASKKDYDQSTWFVMVQRTANIIQTKIGVQKLESNADDFLEQVIRDYNHLHQS